MVVPYKCEPLTDFSNKENELAFLHALKQLERELGKSYELQIGGKRYSTDEKIVSINPANKEEVIGVVSKADRQLADQAVQTAYDTFESWRKTDPVMRAEILFKAAAIVRRRKHEFSAMIVKEAGKPWHEADADVAEGIDFLEYYGRQMLKLKDGVPVEAHPEERNTFTYIPPRSRSYYFPVEFPLCHYGRNNRSRHRYREHGCVKAGISCSGGCGEICGSHGRSRFAGRGPEFCTRKRR